MTLPESVTLTSNALTLPDAPRRGPVTQETPSTTLTDSEMAPPESQSYMPMVAHPATYLSEAHGEAHGEPHESGSSANLLPVLPLFDDDFDSFEIDPSTSFAVSTTTPYAAL